MKNRILVVDDNMLVGVATARLVQHITGAPAEYCESGEAAMRIFQSAPGSIECIITDYEMPGMNGLELGCRLRRLDPGIKLLLVTGNPSALEGVDIQWGGFDCMLVKPFSLATMREALLHVLPPLNNSTACSTHDLYGDTVLFIERPRGIHRAIV